jgi:hypothetical protein
MPVTLNFNLEPQGHKPLEDLRVDRRIILKETFGADWIELAHGSRQDTRTVYVMQVHCDLGTRPPMFRWAAPLPLVVSVQVAAKRRVELLLSSRLTHLVDTELLNKTK